MAETRTPPPAPLQQAHSSAPQTLPHPHSHSGAVSEDVHLSLLCRVCGQTSIHLIPIFEGEGLENNLSSKINSYLPVKVNVNDKLPLQLCFQCASALVTWHNLYQCCLQTNTTLNSKLSKVHTPEDNLDPAKANLDDASSNTKRYLPDNNSRTDQTDDNKNIFVAHNTLGLIKVNVDKKYLPAGCDRCAFCNVTFKEINVLLSHMLDCHPDYFFHCDVCGSYIDRSQLIPHMSQHADEEDKAEETNAAVENQSKDDVGTTAKSTTSKEKHTKKSGNQDADENNDAFSNSSHSNDRFGPLPDSVFEAIKDTEESNVDPQPKTLEQSCQDMKEMSEKLSSRNVNSTQTNSRVCPICSKAFRVTSSYHYHMKHFHGGVKEHVCNVCGRSFGIKSALTSHLTVHSGEKPYSCPACSKQFRSKASIYIHYNNVHCERKTFACTMCNRSFKWKQKLLRHISSHTKEKKHLCPKCNRGFAVKYDLTRHMKTHDSAKPFYCDKCGMSFRQRRYLKQHTEKKHSVVAT